MTIVWIVSCKFPSAIHDKGIVHNDLKLDNVAIGSCSSGLVKAYIIDLGKACQLECGRMYTLTEAEREKYKKDHSQIAPDLRNTSSFSRSKLVGVICRSSKFFYQYSGF